MKRSVYTEKDRAFRRTVLNYYKKHGRHDLPWRTTTDPYAILVSEIMLQQTQVPRVRVKYAEFLEAFPTVRSLAAATLGDVLRLWQGLGYNRRAKLLHSCAQEVVKTHNGVLPQSFEELVSLSGIGPYTAGAVMAFAFNRPCVMIETNIRTVYLFHYFDGATDVTDRMVAEHIARTLEHKNPREWYAALMDYGAHLKRTYGNHNARSRHFKKQSAFKGSDREIRGAIVRELAHGSVLLGTLNKRLASFSAVRIGEQLRNLIEEGMVEKRGQRYRLP